MHFGHDNSCCSRGLRSLDCFFSWGLCSVGSFRSGFMGFTILKSCVKKNHMRASDICPKNPFRRLRGCFLIPAYHGLKMLGFYERFAYHALRPDIEVSGWTKCIDFPLLPCNYQSHPAKGEHYSDNIPDGKRFMQQKDSCNTRDQQASQADYW